MKVHIFMRFVIKSSVLVMNGRIAFLIKLSLKVTLEHPDKESCRLVVNWIYNCLY